MQTVSTKRRVGPSPARARITALPAGQVRAYRGPLSEIALSNFGGYPWYETAVEAAQLVERLAHDALNPGFHLAVAGIGTVPVGFAYGVSSSVLATLAGRGSGVGRLPFELRELAVLPHVRGLGIGAALHDTLIAAAPDRPRWLSAHPHAGPALALYRRRGWRVERLWPVTGNGGAVRLLMYRPT